MPGSTARVTYSSPFTLVSIISSQSSVDPSCSGAIPRDKPALLTRISTACHSAGRLPSLSATSACRRTSRGINSVSVPCRSFSPAASSSRRSARRADRISRAPSAASAAAVAAPIPELAPVTRTVWPLIDNDGMPLAPLLCDPRPLSLPYGRPAGRPYMYVYRSCVSIPSRRDKSNASSFASSRPALTRYCSRSTFVGRASLAARSAATIT